MRLRIRAPGAGIVSLSCCMLAMCSSCTRPGVVDHSSVVRDALLAQAEGGGGCKTLTQVDTIPPDPFFKKVDFLQAECVLEHGDTAFTRVAIDRDGTVFLLDSPSSLQFLLRRHPPEGIDSSTLVDYAERALIYSGEASPGIRVVRTPDDLSDGLLAIVQRSRSTIVLSHVQYSEHNLRTIWITTLFGHTITTYGLLLDDRTGHITIVSNPKDFPGGAHS